MRRGEKPNRNASGAASCIAVIPARGGSKGIPKKNLQTVGGRNLVSRAVKTASDAAWVNRVVVSTDDEDIAKTASDAGALVVWRPAHLATDESSSEEVVIHAIQELMAGCPQEEPGIAVLLQGTSPFTVSAFVDAVVEQVIGSDCDAAFSAYQTNVYLWREFDDGYQCLQPNPTPRLPRQVSGLSWVETGAVYATEWNSLLETRSRFGLRPSPVACDESRALEIDDLSQLHWAQELARVLD